MGADDDSVGPMLAGSSESHCYYGLPRPVVHGLVVVCVMAASQTASSELTHAGLHALHAPFFTMWVHTSFMVLVLPLVAGAQCLISCVDPRTSRWSTRPLQAELWDDDSTSSGSWLVWQYRPACIPPLVWLAFCFYVIWVAANYCYAHALIFSSPGLVTSVFSSCSAFVALLSWVWLREAMTPAKLTSVALAVGGILVLGLAHGVRAEGHNPLIGMLLALSSSVSAAVYKVAFKVAFPEGLPMRRLSLFLSLIGLVNIAVGQDSR